MRFQPIATVRHHVRTAAQIAPGRPAVWIGLRMAAAMTLPLLLSPWLAPLTAIAASLAAYLITLVDKGGAYRTRALMMAFASVCAVIAAVIGGLVAKTPLAAPVVIAGFMVSALGQVLGPARATVTTPMAILLAVSAFRVGPPLTLVQAVAGTAFGAAWAMLLALILWPVRVYMPGRRAIANVLDELAAHARAMADVFGERGDRAHLLARHRRVREQLEVARETMVATRRGRGERDRGERLLALVHVAERLFGALLALEEALDAAGDRLERDAAARALRARADMFEELADRVLDEQGTSAALHGDGDDAVDALGVELRALFVLIEDHLRTADRLITSLDDHAPSLALAIEEAELLAGGRLRDAFDLDSAVVRHAFRVALSCTIAVIIAAIVHLEYAHWVLLTVYLLLQPYHSTTVTRTIQRGIGTVAGALVAAVLAWLIPDPRVLIPLTIAFAAIGASVLQLNFGLFSLFVTPTFVLLAEIQTHDYGLVGIRVLYTLLGGLIAVLASTLLWRSRERVLFDDLLADAIGAESRYMSAVQHAIATSSPIGSVTVVRARRAFGLALANAEVALERMITERLPAELVEPRMAAVAIARRLGGAVNVLGAMRFLDEVEQRKATLADDLGAAEHDVRELADAVREHRPHARPTPAVAPDERAHIAPMRRIHSFVDALFSLDLAVSEREPRRRSPRYQASATATAPRGSSRP